MTVFKNINKKSLDLVRKLFSQMMADPIKKLVRKEIIRNFFINEKGSIHDLLQKINTTSKDTYGIKPIGIRSLQLILKNLQNKGELEFERVKPTQAELISKYGTPIPNIIRYSHQDVNINNGEYTFLKLKKNFVFKKEITKAEEQVIKHVVQIFKKNQGEGNEHQDLIDNLSDFVSHGIISNNQIKGSENKSYQLAFKKIKQALNENAVLEIQLKSRNSKDVTRFHFHTHFLKMWKNKWYAFGINSGSKINPYVLPVDTLIQQIKLTTKKIKKGGTVFLGNDGNPGFFDDIIGVTNIKERSVENIKLKIHNIDRFNRLKLNRVHHSISWNDEKMEITLKVKRNPELEIFLMEHVDEVEVLKPISLRKSIKQRLKKAQKIYT